jgi:hypothetical protein
VALLDDATLAWAGVLIGGMRIQAPSMHAIIARARALGRRTVVGGPAATTAPDEFADADVVFVGEVEGRERELWVAITGTDPLRVPAPTDRPALATARRPRFELLDLDAYASMSVQYSRGCPFRCEFCDVIEIFGRVPRVKSPDQVIDELEALHRLGWRGTVFLVDDNFIGNRREVAMLLPVLAAWQAAHDRPMALYTEASVDLAGEPALLAGMAEAGFGAVFLGIETPSETALRGIGKTQNLRRSPAGAIWGYRRLERAAPVPRRAGYADLLAELYTPEAYLARCLAHLALAPVPATRVRAGGLRIAARALWRLGVVGSRRAVFWRLLVAAVRRSPAFTSWAIEKAIQGEHLIRYTEEQVVPRIRAAAAALAIEPAPPVAPTPAPRVARHAPRSVASH